MLASMGIGIALGSGALISITLAVWLVLAYRRNAELSGDLAASNVVKADLRNKLEIASTTLVRVTEATANQALRDATRISDLEAKLAHEVVEAIKRGVPPGGDLAASLSRGKT